MTGSEPNLRSGPCQCEKCRKVRDDTRRTIAAIPYALAVPVLVVMAQSALTAQGWPLKYTLLSNVFHPVIVLMLLGVALASLFVLKHFVDHAASRWAALILCVIGLTAIARLLTPALTH